MAATRSLTILLAGLVAVLLVAPMATPGSTTAAAPQEGSMMIDDESFMDHDCQQLTGPDQLSTASVTGGQDISLDTVILLDVEGMAAVARLDDGTPEGRAAYDAAVADLAAPYAELLQPALPSYDALDITMDLQRYELLQPLAADGTERDRTDNAQELIDLAKAQMGGGRPADTDIVYVLTDLDIQLPGLGNAVAGLADCIGGVTYDDRAFAVGEVSDEIDLSVYTFYKDATAKIFAHEVGHLMGGHHHYQTCGDVVPGAFLGNGEVGPCSLMTNFVDFLTLPFGVTNGLVVRGHAEAYATGNDDPAGGARTGLAN